MDSKLKRWLRKLNIEEISLVTKPSSRQATFRFIKSESADPDTTEVTPEQLVAQALAAVDAAFREAGHEPTVDERIEALSAAIEDMVDEVDPNQLNAIVHAAIGAVRDDEVVEIDVDELAEEIAAEAVPDEDGQ